MAVVKTLRCSHHQARDLVGIGEASPALTWIVEADAQNWKQRAYEIRIVDEAGKELHATGTVQSADSAFVPWPAKPLVSRQRVEVSVRVQGESDNDWSAWSQPLAVETGLLSNSDWKAKFISTKETSQGEAVLMRREFKVGSGPIAKARLYVTAKGVYEVEINGARVGDEVLAPGWTAYQHRIIHQTHDVTKLLATGGVNAIGAHLAEGWYCGRLGWQAGVERLYGPKPAVLAQLEITYADGSVDTVVSDDSWTTAAGPITFASIYDGETYDATKEIDGWSRPGSPAGTWVPVEAADIDANIEGPVAPPIRNTEVLQPVEIFKSASGKTIIDFGQNLVGVPRFKHLKAPRGHTITIKQAEVMENDELGVRPLRCAKATDHFTAAGTGDETYAPRFTYHGFRYAQIDNWPGEFTKDNVEAIVQHTDFEQTGFFQSSNSKLNRLHDNVRWSMRGNFFSVPTDCPQRDERLGWTGDIALFAPTANYLYSCQGLLNNWLEDFWQEQKQFGVAPVVCPSVLHAIKNFFEQKPIAAWQDATVLVPWHTYRETGDKNILARQYASMKHWVDGIPRDSEGIMWDPKCLQLGDWLDPAAPPDRPDKTKTDPIMVANAYLIQSTEILAEAAKILGKTDDAKKYSDAAAAQRAKFQHEYVSRSGRVVCESQTAYALAIVFKLLDIDAATNGTKNTQLSVASAALAHVVEQDRFNIGTGFVGTPIICDALVQAGHLDKAYKMLLNESCPSWLYPITMGATTTWERWDSMLPNGKINEGEMTSFNHYALGAVADWMHRTIGGLESVAAGWKEIRIQPRPGGDLQNAETRHETPYGTVSSSWTVNGNDFSLEVVVPANTTATVILPDGKEEVVGSGSYKFSAKL